MHDQELEQVLRAGLAARAEEADTTAPVVDRARADVGRRRRTRWSMVGAAAAVTVIAGGASVVAVTGNEPPDFVPLEVDRTPGTADREWRTEYWADVAVDVPADWGYGGAPSSGRGRVACYPTPMVTADGEHLERLRSKPEVSGYVGRPITMTDSCAGYVAGAPFEANGPFVWLGAAVPPGVIERDGFVQETVEVNGTTLTVGTTDDALRERILSTARGGEICAAYLDRIPRADYAMTDEGRGDLLHAEVCAYHRSDDGDYRLSYARTLNAAVAEETYAAAEAAPRATVDCDDDPFEFVVVQATYDDPFGSEVLQRTAIYTMGCGGSVDVGDRWSTHTMTPQSAAPWATHGIPATVYGPSSAPWVYDYFIGPQG
ncbi:hypothetical protein HNR19_002732 [Nocardioides thalensis]|uniref:Uncharacterized protein n=1 Tax=Nocardioides thalensis TaxID=1914755 RepID=A0A853C3Q5_9ACTN|nr:hypothetical protein [Nocardioides thalensis]NYJ02034.1 hypothetical protein [Nocardioides thalensis]